MCPPLASMHRSIRDGMESQSLLMKSALKSSHCSLSRSVRTLRDTDGTWYLSLVLLPNSSHTCSVCDKSGVRADHGNVRTRWLLKLEMTFCLTWKFVSLFLSMTIHELYFRSGPLASHDNGHVPSEAGTIRKPHSFLHQKSRGEDEIWRKGKSCWRSV